MSQESVEELAILVGAGIINTPTLVKNLSKFSKQNISHSTIQLDAEDRVGLLRDVTQVISDEGINITAISTIELETGKRIIITVDSNGLQQQNRIYSIIDNLEGVRNIETMNN